MLTIYYYPVALYGKEKKKSPKVTYLIHVTTVVMTGIYLLFPSVSHEVQST